VQKCGGQPDLVGDFDLRHYFRLDAHCRLLD
jgi:hypothetical protein